MICILVVVGTVIPLRPSAGVRSRHAGWSSRRKGAPSTRLCVRFAGAIVPPRAQDRLRRAYRMADDKAQRLWAAIVGDERLSEQMAAADARWQSGDRATITADEFRAVLEEKLG